MDNWVWFALGVCGGIALMGIYHLRTTRGWEDRARGIEQDLAHYDLMKTWRQHAAERE